ncbi:Aste57867_1489 [Aphanomyces stellatus]|uniref:Aste57867_1489 protein n=1 Tax=Aphanomyces stellatus TaxID=120398 RepID=A0A485K9I8_9STRA|nr:hypothetical protein As57867_001488 [Aphanomyces stellatus]VFT78705.1 Aste57867_1489 [Aphanomyces stellatus]
MVRSSYQSVERQVPSRSTHHPLSHASLFSKVFFNWATPLLQLGNDRQLDPHDLWSLQAENQCDVAGRAFELEFNTSRSILRTMATVFGWRWALIVTMQVTIVGCSLFGPYVLQQIVSSMELSFSDEAASSRHSLQLVAALVLVRVASALLTTHSSLHTQLIVVQASSALQNLLYQKTQRLDAAARRTKSTGEISNLFLKDIPTIVDFSTVFNQLLTMPLQLVLTLVFLYNVIGWSTFAGVVVIVAMLGVNQIVANGMQQGIRSFMKIQDSRMRTLNEVFGALHTIKLNAWEERFSDKIAADRSTELASLKRVFVWNATGIVLMFTGPTLVTIASFASYTMLQHESLSASKLFTALSLFTLLKDPFARFSVIYANAMRTLVSLRRLATFLELSETTKQAIVLTPATIDPPSREAFASQAIVVAIERVSVSWMDSTPLFNNISLAIQQGQLVVLHGAVGQGKSSLCLALLGELNTTGSIFVDGRVAYVAQQPWIQHMTIRDNILFGLPYDHVKYNRVVEACALTADLALFPAGDRTEIGHKGVTLSGGQKARVSLARACYSDADVYLLDSPLAAVDASVQNEIFTKCFLGLLAHKTVLLVTHSQDIIHSKAVDRTVEVQGGQLIQTIVEKDTLPEPLAQPLGQRGAMLDGEFFADTYDDNGTASPNLDIHPSLCTPDCCMSDFDDKASGQLVADEDRVDGNVSLKVYRDYLDAWGGWGAVLALVVTLALWQGLTVASDLWLNRWSATAATTSSEAFEAQASFYIGMYATLALSGVVATVLRTYVVVRGGLRASTTLFDRLTAALLHAPMQFFDRTPVGRVLNRYANDINTVDVDLPLSIGGLSNQTFRVVCTLGTAVYMTQYLGLLVLPLVYAYIRLGRFFIQPIRSLERLSKTAKSPLLSLICESIDGLVVIRAFGANHLRRFQCLHFRNVDAANASTFAKEVATQWLTLRIQLTSTAILGAVSASLVVLHDRLNPGLVGLALNYVLSSLSLLEYLVPMFAKFETLMVASERVLEYSSVAPEAPRVLPGAVPKAWPVAGEIRFDKTSFRYKPHDPLVLNDVTLHIHAGEKIGIVGRTGAGKSSLTMALLRINELASGSIWIDGVDISKVGLKTLRSAISLIPQTPVLFKGTLRSVLDPLGDFSDDQLWASLRKVHLADRIASVVGKLDGPVDENGDNFSVGERQMLCMARALLRRASIVVMDEATAAIDHETDQKLQHVIRTEFATSTVLSIAHRLDTVLNSDRVLVLGQGRVVQCDAPSVLIGQGAGIFFELCTQGGYLEQRAMGRT